ncbi:sigma-70 family RNA polymerase sigma factor [Catellatospora coxensis]
MTTNELRENRMSDAAGRLRDAFGEHRRDLHLHCYHLVGNVPDADDLVQETFLRAWRARDRFEGRASVRTWLYRIATNAFLDSRKAAGNRAVPSGDLLEWSTDIGPIPMRCWPLIRRPVSRPGRPSSSP